MVYIQLKAVVRDFFFSYMNMIGDKILFPYILENQSIDHESWNENGIRIPVTKEQLSWLKSLFTNAKIHTVFDGRISGRIADCKVATWQLDKSTRLSLTNDYVEVDYNRKKYYIPVNIFSLKRFEIFSGIRAGIRTHKPKAPFETFYHSFISRVS